jgi:hypothetical protein
LWHLIPKNKLDAARRFSRTILFAGDVLNETDNAAAQLGVANAHERLGQYSPSEVARKSDT